MAAARPSINNLRVALVALLSATSSRPIHALSGTAESSRVLSYVDQRKLKTFGERRKRGTACNLVEASEAIVIMGQLLKDDSSPTDVMKKRVQKAVDVYRSHGFPIICSGGDPQGRGVTEAEVMQRLLMQSEVPESSICKETMSANTVQNALNVLSMSGPSMTAFHIVTSDFHMPRSAYVWKAVLASQDKADITLVRHPVSGGCPLLSTVGADDSDGKHETVNDMTQLERLQLEQQFLANETYYLEKDCQGTGVTVNPLPDSFLANARGEVDRMIAEAKEQEAAKLVLSHSRSQALKGSGPKSLSVSVNIHIENGA